MGVLSFSDLKDNALPALWDTAEIKKIELADGSTFDLVVADLRAGLQSLNAELLTTSHYGGLLSVTDEATVSDIIDSGTNGVEEATEYGIPTPRRGNETGHMLPLKKYDRALGWTFMSLRDARQSKLDSDVRSAFTDIRDAWQKHTLTRFFKMEAEKVGSTAAASVPFADGGTNDATYVPPSSGDGLTFLYTHDHYLRTATLNQAALNAAVAHLQEHGHKPPFDIVASRADIATWTNTTTFTGYKAPEWAGIVYRAAQDRAQVADVSEFFGYIETPYGIARLWLSNRVPTNYFGVYRSYGDGDARNPLRVRINPRFGFGWNIVSGQYVNAPQVLAVMYAEYGFGIGEDRTNGVLTYINAAGDYVTPTIA